MAKGITPEDADVLRYVGLLGHTHVVVVTVERTGKRSADLETCDIRSAREYAYRVDAALNPKVYRKTKHGWTLA